MNGSQALKNALGNPVLLSPPLFFHPDTTGMSTISGENENQIAYQELTIWGSWLLPPSPLPDVSSLPLTTWYWVVVSPVSPSKSVFMLQPSTFPQVLHFLRMYPLFPLVSLGLCRLHLFVWLPPRPPFLLPWIWTAGLEIRRGGQEENVSRWDLPDIQVACGETEFQLMCLAWTAA